MLHIVNKSPLQNSTLASCLSVAAPGAILLIEDAVTAATAGGATEAMLREAMARHQMYALQPDLDACGLGDRLMAGVTAVDFGGFVDLVANNKNCQSWL